MKDILERKWTSVAKLKKELDELTKQNKILKEQQAVGGCERCNGLGLAGLNGAGALMNATMTSGFGDGLPKEPERYTLKGHKSRVTKVALHPIYADVASSSEDGTIKVWDFESGELMHTMKGHTGSVNYVSYHPNG